MDAFVVTKIYQQLLNEYSEQHIGHFMKYDEIRQNIKYN
jgi:hypothetical protein